MRGAIFGYSDLKCPMAAVPGNAELQLGILGQKPSWSSAFPALNPFGIAVTRLLNPL